MVSEDEETGDHGHDEYEEVVEYECPICSERVTENDNTCPSCGAIFVTSEQMEQEIMEDLDVPEDEADLALDAEVKDETLDIEASHEDEFDIGVEAEADYDLDDELDDELLADMDDEAIEAELAVLEEELGDELLDDYDEEPLTALEVPEEDVLLLDLGYEEDVAEEEEVEAAFGTAVEVTPDDHLALEAMAKPTMMETLFQRAGLGMFIAGGALTVLVMLWDPFHGETIAMGAKQLQLLVFCLSLFIVGFAIEMLQAYSLAAHDETLHYAAVAAVTPSDGHD